MEESGTLTDLLSDPRVKAYFLHLVQTSLSAEEKYCRFVEYCSSQLAVTAELPSGFTAAELAGNLREINTQLIDCLARAVGRMQRSQHMDGGWGPQVEQSAFWHTAYAVIFLKTVEDLQGVPHPVEIGPVFQRGIEYLERHPEFWSADTLSQVAGLSVYDVGLMARCFYQAGRASFRRESAARAYRSIDRLYHSQNDDGGWDANIWGYEINTPVRTWSEVGATGAALQALSEVGDERFRLVVEKGMGWLAATQNSEGSWNDGSCHPILPDCHLSGSPAVTKTCDALQGLLSGTRLGVSLDDYMPSITRAVDWLRRQEKPVFDRQNRVTGWGWGYTAADYEQTCLTLETLLRLPNPPLAVLAANANWLLQGQHRQADDPEDGGWTMGHTARIALALAAFYRRLHPDTRLLIS